LETVIQGSTLQTLRAGLHAGDGGRGRGFSRRVAHATRPFQTGDTYVNFMELEGASAERVKAAYAREDFERLIALIALKDRYDPQNAFRFNRNIAPSKAER
jgi:hypothetical protein